MISTTHEELRQDPYLPQILRVLHCQGYRRGGRVYDDSHLDRKETFFSKNRKELWDLLLRFSAEPSERDRLHVWMMVLENVKDYPSWYEINIPVKRVVVSRIPDNHYKEHYTERFVVEIMVFDGYNAIVVEFDTRQETISFELNELKEATDVIDNGGTYSGGKFFTGICLIHIKDYVLAQPVEWALSKYVNKWRDYCNSIREMSRINKEMNEKYVNNLSDILKTLNNA